MAGSNKARPTGYAAAALFACAALGVTIAAQNAPASAAVKPLVAGTAAITHGTDHKLRIVVPVTASAALDGVSIKSYKLPSAKRVLPASMPVAIGSLAAEGQFSLDATFDSTKLRVGKRYLMVTSLQYQAGRKKKSYSVKTTFTLPIPTNPGPSFDLSVNGTDALATSGTTPDGHRVEVFGSRDAEGLTAAIETVRTTDAAGNTTTLSLDGQGKPEETVASNGVRVQYHWLDGDSLLATVLAPDGSRLNVPIDLPVNEGLRRSAHAQGLVVPVASPYLINVTRNGSLPVNTATVELVARVEPPVNGSPERVYPARLVANGQYAAYLPAPDPSAVDRATSQCDRIAALLDELSDEQLVGLLTTLIPAITSAIENYPGGYASAQAVLAAANEIIAQIAVLRDTFPFHQVLTTFCNLVTRVVNRQLPDQQFRIVPRVTNVPRVQGPVLGVSRVVRPSDAGPYTPFTVDVGNLDGSGSLHAILTWDKADTDVDMHVMNTNGDEIAYYDKQGIPNGFLDVDDVDGFGPENVYIDPLEAGVDYRVFLHYYSDHSNGPTTARVQVFQDEALVTDFTATLSNHQIVDVGTYSGPVVGSPIRVPRIVGAGSTVSYGRQPGSGLRYFSLPGRRSVVPLPAK